MLEAQAEAHRKRRPAGPVGFQSPSFRYGSIIAIAIFGLGSLGMLEWFLSQMPKPVHSSAPPVPSLIAGKSGTAP